MEDMVCSLLVAVRKWMRGRRRVARIDIVVHVVGLAMGLKQNRCEEQVQLHHNKQPMGDKPETLV